MRDRWAVLVLLAGCVLAVVACTPSDEPGTLPDRTDSVTTPAPTPTPTVTPTATDPSAALEAEIETFFRAYIDTVNESWTSTEALARRREMFADSCEDCFAGYTFAQRAHDEGLVLEGRPLEVVEVSVSRVHGSTVDFVVQERSPSGVLRRPTGEVVERFVEYPKLSVGYTSIIGPSNWVLVDSRVLR